MTMTTEQVDALHTLMRYAQFPGQLDLHDDVKVEVIVTTWSQGIVECRLFTKTTTLVQYIRSFYIKSDGTLCMWDIETGKELVPCYVKWRPHYPERYQHQFIGVPLEVS